jgi:hypothetical protein
VAHEVDFFEAEVIDEGSDIVRHRLEVQRAVDVGLAPIGLQIDGDNLPAFCEQQQDLAEHLDRASAAMQQDQRLAYAVDLVVHAEAVHQKCRCL